MSENEPNLDSVSQIRMEFEQLRDKREFVGPHTAVEMLSYYEGAAPFFELGIKLGKEGSSPEVQALASDINKEIETRIKQLRESAIPTLGSTKKSGG